MKWPGLGAMKRRGLGRLRWGGVSSPKAAWASAAMVVAVVTAVAGLTLHRLGPGSGNGVSGSTDQKLVAGAQQSTHAEQANDVVLAADQKLAAEVRRRYGVMKLLQFAGQPEISVAEWKARPTDRPAVLVDVREPHERRVSMLPGAITREDFERNSARYRSWLVVPYCTIGVRSGHYTRTLRTQGFEARNLAGSALAWAHAGLPFEADGKVTRRVHVYDPAWNLLPHGYVPVVSGAQPLNSGG